MTDIQHYGTKGMKWGERKKKYSAGEIHGARYRQEARRRQLNAAADQLNLASGSGSKAQTMAAGKKYVKALGDYNMNEDRVTASRMTKGEKWATAILTGPLAAVVIPVNAGYTRAVAKDVDRVRKATAS